MSKNIIIQEGGISKQLTADKLKTNIVGGGTCTWVPEDETRLGTKYISENGTYKASDDALYGYSEVTVSGIGTATGKYPDGSGDDAKATVDPETGEITVTKIPSSIRVIEPPTNPYGTYLDGQAITKDGMVVNGYLQSGGEWGVVPNSEIALNPTAAVYDKTTDFAPATSDLIDFAIPIGYAATPTFERATSYVLDVGVNIITGGPAGFVKDSGVLFVIFASDNPTTTISYTVDKYGRKDKPSEESQELSYVYELIGSTPYGPYSVAESYTYNGKTVYWAEQIIMNQGQVDYPGILSVDSWPVDIRKKVAWTMVYGNIGEAGGHQTITVSWPRPGDGKILETTFEILVAPGYTPGGGE